MQVRVRLQRIGVRLPGIHEHVHQRVPRRKEFIVISTESRPGRRVVRGDVTPDHTEPDGDRQPREHPVPCSRCHQPTWNISAVCGRQHG